MNTGIVGFFDILGYKSFLKNNPDDGAQQVVTKLVGLKESLGAEIHSALSHYQPASQVTELVGLLKWLVFSDTIMLYTEFDHAETHGKRSNKWIVMNFACLLLWRRMFQYGLPLRGVIHVGEFIVEQSCFAGTAIIDAYTLSQDMDFAGVAYSSEAFDSLVTHANSPHEPLIWSWIPAQLFEYLIPRKSGKSERLCVINPLTVMLKDHNRFLNEDIRQLVSESFLSHNKDIPAEAVSKVNHTEDYLRASLFTFTHMNESIQRMTQWEKKPANNLL